jgi:hypothetical protein
MGLPLISPQMNEVAFNALEFSGERGQFPNIMRVISRFGCRRSTSAAQFNKWEQWIQWVTVNTGPPLSKHGMFQFGDHVPDSIKQLWQSTETQGRTVRAVSPMNAIRGVA